MKLISKTPLLMLLALGLSLAGCWRAQMIEEPMEKMEVQSTEIERWEPVPLRQHPAWGQKMSAWGSWKEHCDRSLKQLQFSKSLPPSHVVPDLNREMMIDTLQKISAASQGSESQFWEALDRDFIYLRPKSREIQPAFFTGYYTPIYHGSRTASAVYHYPVYGPPADLKSNASIYSRIAIDRADVLKGKGLEICYLSSPLEAYLLQVQGSASVVLDDGSSLGLGFAADNGRAYVSLGKMLVERGLIKAKDISLTSIRNYYRRHPKDVEDLMLLNERYIFFTGNDGLPRGSTGAVVEAFHSLATERFDDRSYRFPPHQPMLITLSLPHMGLSTLPVLCQDTGSAIRGEARADIYLGEGLAAERIAGELKHRGQMAMLWPKNIPLPKSIAGDPVVRGGMMP